MPKYKLSICIPTYNRSKYLPELIESIMSQSEGSDVEIVISDNASTDNTEEVLNPFLRKYKNIVYSVSENNAGPDRNFFRAVSLANAEYCWLMGSDEKLDIGALKLVLNSLATNKDVYLQDRVECDIEMFRLQRRSWWKNSVKKEWDFSNDDINHYFEQCTSLGGVFSFLSSIVVKKKKWDNYIPLDSYYETAYSHVYPLLSVLKDGGTLSLLEGSGILSRGGNDHFSLEGACKRRLIDFRGYSMLSIDLKLPNIMEVLHREHSVKSVSVLFMGCIPVYVAAKYARRAGFSYMEINIAIILGFMRRVRHCLKINR